MGKNYHIFTAFFQQYTDFFKVGDIITIGLFEKYLTVSGFVNEIHRKIITNFDYAIKMLNWIAEVIRFKIKKAKIIMPTNLILCYNSWEFPEYQNNCSVVI